MRERLAWPCYHDPGRKRTAVGGGEGAVGIVSLILVGLIAGILARIAMPGPDPGGVILTIVIGIVGAFIGGFIVDFLGGPAVTGFNLSSILIATLGAIILLAVYRLITRRVA